jgi:hypothetical protein
MWEACEWFGLGAIRHQPEFFELPPRCCIQICCESGCGPSRHLALVAIDLRQIANGLNDRGVRPASGRAVSPQLYTSDMQEHPMVAVREPVLKPIAITDLRPTQITVGMREVEGKRKGWREKKDKKAAEFLGKHMIPVILGPSDRLYIIDHHHLTRALHEEGVKDVLVAVVANLSMVDPDTFWRVLDNRRWMHPFDDKGRRRDYKDIPKSVRDLVDDPFRSLAGELRRAGGFAKDTTPFSEFLWADFLRRRIKRRLIERDFDRALITAMKCAKSQEAIYLPGWGGPASPD